MRPFSGTFDSVALAEELAALLAFYCVLARILGEFNFHVLSCEIPPADC